MNLSSETNKVIVKYALLLVVLYAIQLTVSYLLMYLYPIPTNNLERLWTKTLPLIVVIIGNVITMYFVLKDKKQFNIQNRYLGVLTLCFRPVAVCILLIQMVLESREASAKVKQSEEQ